MEALTAVVLLVGRYGVQELVSALTGRRDLGGLAGELFAALAESESRISDRLTQVEQRLGSVEHRIDELLDQRYQAALNAGARSLLDAAAEVDPDRRADEFAGARGRFLEASVAARSLLQTAVAERYLLLCAIALGRPLAARVAWDRINGMVTTAAIDLGTAFRSARSTAVESLKERGEAKGRRYEERLKAEAARVREYITDAASVIERLLVEAGVLGEAIGQPAPSRIRLRVTAETTRTLPPLTLPTFPGLQQGRYPGPQPWREPRTFSVPADLRWFVDPVTAAPTRFGALSATWNQFETLPDDKPKPGIVGHLQEPPYPRATHTRNVQINLTIEADPALPRRLSIYLPGASRARITGPSREPPARHELASSERRYQLSEIVAVPADESGNVTGADAVCLDDIVLVRYPGSEPSSLDPLVV